MSLVTRTAAILVVAIPLALASTLALVPAWRWLEAEHDIESIGHSGPATWCYAASYLACVVLLATITITVRRRRRARA